MIKVLVSDDHSLVRKGIMTLLDNESDIKVVGEATNGKEAVKKARKLKPDVILMDLSMPGIDGMEATRKITASNLKSKVLILTVHEEEGYFKEALEAGGSGYILKKAADVELLSAIRAVYREEVFIYPSMTKILLSNYLTTEDNNKINKKNRDQKEKCLSCQQENKNEIDENQDQDDNYSLLSNREREVFELVAKGYTNKQIGQKLVISVKTVETHKFRMMKKLELNKRSEIVRLAIKKGIL
ncbi:MULTISPECIES: response regulator transcription factor [unclassified Candidatus Frackibacter]|uniref:response regulator transcription factor n=1 Tax=unclassified Candidatus Frackibacter TaxID=2648818 RepID=UPI00087E0396|nr:MULTISPECIES: response regulator transcription factor [unclassified Candidatus Frackibacter]SDC00152.1 two component transcriptional regulator, LuxR family [Candidatus Frackibacter sp. WG11]SEM31687.1 two component transcriptional regulator, LuxR family [Candidatus Frackibacter sp. WG12]SFL36608.1 two component transcriptional regulator, LuxR family [Candidatus Frackibacter sp. WG13]